MTFEQFQATGRECNDLGKALNDAQWDGGPPGIGRLYLGALYIEQAQPHWTQEARDAGRWHLIIGRDECITDDLVSLERRLYEFAVSEEYVPNPVMQITGLNHFNIATTDLEASARFYEALGLRRGHRPDFGNTGVWLYIGDKPKVHLNLESEVGPCVHGTGVVHHLGFDVDGSLDAVCAKLKGLGIEYRLWPTEVPGWYRALYFKGPSGEEIEFVLKDTYVEPKALVA